MTNALGYTRLSQQSDTSIPRQKRNIRAYCEDHDLQLVTIYDDGESASGFETESRDAYQRLKTDVRDGRADAVVVNDKRRLARDVDEVMRLVPDLRTNGVALHTCQDGPLDLSDPMRAAIEILQAAAAHEEKMSEIEKAREAVRERVADPEVDHGPPKFGMAYDDDGRRQVPSDDFEAVRDIFALRDRGLTYEEISDRTGVALGTISRVLDRREWYEARAEI